MSYVLCNVISSCFSSSSQVSCYHSPGGMGYFHTFWIGVFCKGSERLTPFKDEANLIPYLRPKNKNDSLIKGETKAINSVNGLA